MNHEHRSLVFRWSALLCLLVVACSNGPGPQHRTVLEPSPTPDLSNMDTAVQAQIQHQQAVLNNLFQATASNKEKGEAFGKLAMVYHTYDLLDAARSCYTNAHRLTPQDYRWAYYLGHISKKQGELTKALGYFQTVTKLKKGYLPAVMWQGEIFWERNELDQAAKAFKPIIETDPNHAHALMRMGQISLKRDQPQQAVTFLESAREAQPGASIIYYPLAMAYQALGQEELAQQNMARRGQIKCGTNDPLLAVLDELKVGITSLVAKANDLIKKREYKGAAELYLQALEKEPDHTFALLNLATAITYLGHEDRAIGYLQKALETNPQPGTRGKILFNLGYLHQKQGLLDEAIGYYRNAYKSHEVDQTRTYLALALYAKGEYSQALPHLEALTLTLPKDLVVHATLAKTFYQLGRYQDCLGQLGRGRELTGDAATLLALHAQYLAAAAPPEERDPTKALAIAQQLQQVDTGSLSLSTLAMAQAAAGNFEAAVQTQNQALELTGKSSASQKERLTHNLARYQRGQIADQTMF